MNDQPNDSHNPPKMPPPGGYRPKFALYHANAKGTGSAVKLELHPAHDDVDGSIMLKLASQSSVGRPGANPTCSTFDWETGMVVKLGFSDLTKLLQVFRGETESVNDDHGLFHRAPRFNTVIKLRHVLEGKCGYALELYRSTPGKTDDDRSGYFFFSSAEAFGLSVAIMDSLGVICFGIPRVIPHDTSDYRREAREMRNVSAA